MLTFGIYFYLYPSKCEENSLFSWGWFCCKFKFKFWLLLNFLSFGDFFYYYLQVSSPTIIVERAGFFAWTSKSWRVREKFARTVTSVIGLFSSTELPLQRAILSPVCSLTFTNKQYMFFSFFLFPKKVHVFLLFNIS